MLTQVLEQVTVATTGRGFVEVTQLTHAFLTRAGAERGLLTVFLQHTSASLLVQERADPAVRDDLERFFSRLIVDGDPLFRHDDEGPDDMPAHVRAALTQTSLSVPVEAGRLTLGQWQGLFVWEHRVRAHQRTLSLHFLGTVRP